jgi:hypothetical protein
MINYYWERLLKSFAQIEALLSAPPRALCLVTHSASSPIQPYHQPIVIEFGEHECSQGL